MSDASAINDRYYGAVSSGREDYWRLMAAPRHRVQVLCEVIRDTAPSSLIDLGCGGGQLLEEVRERTHVPVLAGLDLSEAQIRANRERDPRIDWFSADIIQGLPEALAGRRFDLVVSSELIEHLDEPQTFLHRAQELGDRLLLSTQSGPIRPTEVHVGHRQHFSKAQMTRLLSDTGWEPVRVWNTGFPMHDFSKWVANRRPDAALARFGDKPYGPLERAISAGLRLAFRFNSRSRGAQLFALARKAS